MSPDPYSGSYDVTNPQSFNRYSYVLNNPSSMTDPSGREGCLAAIAAGGETGTPVGVGAGLVGCFLEILGIDSFFESLFGGPKFHGTLKPRPNAQPWDEYHMHYGANIADALGIPDAGCEFGACGDGGMSAIGGGIASGSSGSLLHSVIGQVELAELFFQSVMPSNYGAGKCSTFGLWQSGKNGCLMGCEAAFGPNLFDEAFGPVWFTAAQIGKACGPRFQLGCPYSLTFETNHPDIQLPGDINILSCNFNEPRGTVPPIQRPNY